MYLNYIVVRKKGDKRKDSLWYSLQMIILYAIISNIKLKKQWVVKYEQQYV